VAATPPAEPAAGLEPSVGPRSKPGDVVAEVIRPAEEPTAFSEATPAEQAAFSKGSPWNGSAMHLDSCWDPIRSYPPFVEWMRPKG
jgi:hypothetical protein